MATLLPRTDTVLQLTRLSGPVFALNPDLIERVEATPDTVITLVNGSRYIVRESLDELSELIDEFRARVIARAQRMTEAPVAPRPARDPDSRAPVVMLRSGDS